MTYSTAHCGSHPLDLIPLFRRWPCSPFRNLVYTGVWNTLIALFLAGASMMFDSRGYDFLDLPPADWLISNLAGYLIHGAWRASTSCCAAGLRALAASRACCTTSR